MAATRARPRWVWLRPGRLYRVPGGEQLRFPLSRQPDASPRLPGRCERGRVDLRDALPDRARREAGRVGPGRVRRVDVPFAVAAWPERDRLSRLAEFHQEVRVDPGQPGTPGRDFSGDRLKQVTEPERGWRADRVEDAGHRALHQGDAPAAHVPRGDDLDRGGR